jgi:hypothetical protein
MKRSVCLIAVLLMAMGTAARAEYLPGSSNFLINGSYARASTEDSGHGLDGWGISGLYEMTTSTGRWAGGFGFGYLRLQDNLTGVEIKDEVVDGDVTYNTIPLSAQGKLLFGAPSVMGYLSLGLGAQLTKLRFKSGDDWVSGWDSGLLLAAGLGIYTYASDGMFVNFGYNVGWLGNTYYEDNLMHQFIIGLGFQFDRPQM